MPAKTDNNRIKECRLLAVASATPVVKEQQAKDEPMKATDTPPAETSEMYPATQHCHLFLNEVAPAQHAPGRGAGDPQGEVKHRGQGVDLRPLREGLALC